MRPNPIFQHGFTLVELMLALAIASVMMAIGIPSFQSTIKNNRLTVATNETIGAFNFARTEAFRRGNRVHIAEGENNVGWVVWIDADNDNAWDEGEEIRLWSDFPDGVTVDKVNAFIAFDPSGLANQNETITICDDRNGEDGSQLSLLLSGSFSKSKIGCD